MNLAIFFSFSHPLCGEKSRGWLGGRVERNSCCFRQKEFCRLRLADEDADEAPLTLQEGGSFRSV